MRTNFNFFSKPLIFITLALSIIFSLNNATAADTEDLNKNNIFTDPNPPAFADCQTYVILNEICVPVTFELTAFDIESGPVQITASGLPPGAIITPPLPAYGNPVTIEFYWLATPQTLNIYDMIFTAIDSSGNQTTCRTLIDFPLSILSPPVFYFSPCGMTFNILANDTIAFPIQAYETTGDLVILNVSGLPPGAVMTPPLPDTGITYDSAFFRWVPDLSQGGSHFVTFTASDRCGLQTTCVVSFDVVLPVELSSFTSVVLKNEVMLNWTTSTETNNAKFEVERSLSGSDAWNTLASINGFGNSTEPVSYSYTDRSLAIGTHIYRLKQIDFNGNFEYHALSNNVVVGAPSEFSLFQNYPNPFNPVTKIDYEIPVDGNVTLNVYDIGGKLVTTLVNGLEPAGYYSKEFNASNISSGIYYCKMQFTGSDSQIFERVVKMVVLK